MAEYNMTKPQNAADYRTFHRVVRERLLANPGWLNWNRLGKAERQDWLTTYRLGRYGNRFIPTGTDPFAEPASLPKSLPKVGMSCEKCKQLGKRCTGTAPNICPQCAVAGLKPEDCVYLDDSLKLTVPAWYTRGAAAGGRGGGGGGGGVASALNAPIQPAVPNRAGAGLAAIRRPTGRGSPTGMENENVNEENEVNSNASRDPNATEAEIAAGKAKKQARRNRVARNLAASQLNAGNESAKAVQAMAAAAGAGGKRKRKSRKQTLKRKQKFTRKQK